MAEERHAAEAAKVAELARVEEMKRVAAENATEKVRLEHAKAAAEKKAAADAVALEIAARDAA